MNSRASVTVMVTWVCVKESSNIQSGWREVKLNLRGEKNTLHVSYKLQKKCISVERKEI